MKLNVVFNLLQNIINHNKIENEQKLLAFKSKLPSLLTENGSLMSFLINWFQEVLVRSETGKINIEIIFFALNLLKIIIENDIAEQLPDCILCKFNKIWVSIFNEKKFTDGISFLSKYIALQKILLQRKLAQIIIESDSWKPAVELIMDGCCHWKTFLYIETINFIAEFFSICNNTNVCIEITNNLKLNEMNDQHLLNEEQKATFAYRLDIMYHILTYSYANNQYSAAQICALIQNYHPAHKFLQFNFVLENDHKLLHRAAVSALTYDFILCSHKTELKKTSILNLFQSNIRILKTILERHNDLKLIQELSETSVIYLSKLSSISSGDSFSFYNNYMLQIILLPMIVYSESSFEIHYKMLKEKNDNKNEWDDPQFAEVNKDAEGFIMNYKSRLDQADFYDISELFDMIKMFSFKHCKLSILTAENGIYMLNLLLELLESNIENNVKQNDDKSSVLSLNLFEMLNYFFANNFFAHHDNDSIILKRTLDVLNKSSLQIKVYLEAFKLLSNIFANSSSIWNLIDDEIRSDFTRVLIKRLTDFNWEVRDSCLECIKQLIITYCKNETSGLEHCIVNKEILDNVIMMTSDGERFVRYTTYSTLEQIVDYSWIRKYYLNENNVTEIILKSYIGEEEGIVREQMMCLLCKLLINVGFRDDQLPRMCKLMTYIAKKDFHPAAVEYSLKFWARIVNVLVKFSGHFNINRLNLLSYLGCLQALLDIVLLECDGSLIKLALCIIRYIVKNTDETITAAENKQSMRQTQQPPVNSDNTVGIKNIQNNDDTGKKCYVGTNLKQKSNNLFRGELGSEQRDFVIDSIVQTTDIRLLPTILLKTDNDRNNANSCSTNSNNLFDIDNDIGDNSFLSVGEFFNMYHKHITLMFEDEPSMLEEEYFPSNETSIEDVELKKQLHILLDKLTVKVAHLPHNKFNEGDTNINHFTLNSIQKSRERENEEEMEASNQVIDSREEIMVSYSASVLGNDGINNTENLNCSRINDSDSDSEKEFDILDCY